MVLATLLMERRLSTQATLELQNDVLLSAAGADDIIFGAFELPPSPRRISGLSCLIRRFALWGKRADICLSEFEDRGRKLFPEQSIRREEKSKSEENFDFNSTAKNVKKRSHFNFATFFFSCTLELQFQSIQ